MSNWPYMITAFGVIGMVFFQIFIGVVNIGGLTLAALLCYAVYFIARLESFL